MGLFRSQPNSFLGIDLGSGNIKIVELENHSRKPKLRSYGYVELPREDIGENVLHVPQKAAEIIKKITVDSQMASKRAIAALPVSSVFSSIINLPKVSKKELASPRNLAPLIHWEAKKLIPLPLEEMILDWQVLPSEQPSPQDAPKGDQKKKKRHEVQVAKNTRVLLTAASKEYVKKYIEIFKLANMQLMNLETDIFALIRSLVGNDKSTIMIIDIGARTTNLSIVDRGIPYLNKSIDLGGTRFTEAISAKLGVAYTEAEQFKADLSLHSEQKFPEVLKEKVVDLVNEINYSINLFMTSHASRGIEKVILTGGSSLLPSLSEYLEHALNIRVYPGDPWARVIYPEELRPVLDEIGPKFSVAIGLAMRNIN